jgi:murein DD-endopeptidase MepM/ murein hydrolase activator NlpD
MAPPSAATPSGSSRPSAVGAGSAALFGLLLAACTDGTAPELEPIRFAAPIAGTPMVDVFYGSHFDHDPDADAHYDYECGVKAYPGHKGVDILLRNFQVQDTGVAVLAAAPGVVAVTRDGMPDRNWSWSDGADGGNYVILDHGQGTQSIYAHLRRESITVSPDERVRPGEVLGLVGSSGMSNVPHLHFEVQIDRVPVDPFAGPCSHSESLWLSQLPYQNEFAVLDAGIAKLDTVNLGVLLERPPDVREFTQDVESIVFWIQLMNQPASLVRFEVRAPDGSAAHSETRSVSAARSMRYLVLRMPIAGELTERGTWQVRTYQEDELLRIEPFTILAAAAPASVVMAGPQARLEVRVLDVAPAPHW